MSSVYYHLISIKNIIFLASTNTSPEKCKTPSYNKRQQSIETRASIIETSGNNSPHREYNKRYSSVSRLSFLMPKSVYDLNKGKEIVTLNQKNTTNDCSVKSSKQAQGIIVK